MTTAGEAPAAALVAVTATPAPSTRVALTSSAAFHVGATKGTVKTAPSAGMPKPAGVIDSIETRYVDVGDRPARRVVTGLR